MTDDELKAIEARANAATPGPWAGTGDASNDDADVRDARNESVIGAWSIHADDDGLYLTAEDRDFIAAARTDVPALAAEVRRLQHQLAAMYAITGDFHAALGAHDDHALTGGDSVRRLSADNERLTATIREAIDGCYCDARDGNCNPPHNETCDRCRRLSEALK